MNEISEKLNILLKKVRGGGILQRNPFKRNFWKPQNFGQKLPTEDPILLYTKFKKSRSV